MAQHADMPEIQPQWTYKSSDKFESERTLSALMLSLVLAAQLHTAQRKRMNWLTSILHGSLT